MNLNVSPSRKKSQVKNGCRSRNPGEVGGGRAQKPRRGPRWSNPEPRTGRWWSSHAKCAMGEKWPSVPVAKVMVDFMPKFMDSWGGENVDLFLWKVLSKQMWKKKSKLQWKYRKCSIRIHVFVNHLIVMSGNELSNSNEGWSSSKDQVLKNGKTNTFFISKRERLARNRNWTEKERKKTEPMIRSKMKENQETNIPKKAMKMKRTEMR